MVDLLDRCCLLVANASAVIHLRSCLKGSSYVRSAGALFQLSNVPTVDPNFNKKGKHKSTKREISYEICYKSFRIFPKIYRFISSFLVKAVPQVFAKNVR